MKRLLYTTFVVLSFLILNNVHISACTCVSLGEALEKTMKWQVKESDAIFSGKVLSIVEQDVIRNVTLRVDEVWKGDLTDEVLVTTDILSSCSFNFKRDTSYLIFAKSFEGTLSPLSCFYSGELSNRGEVLTALGKGKIPEKKKP